MHKTEKGWVKTISLTPPSLNDNVADADRLKRALCADLKIRQVDMDIALLKKLPSILRNSEYQVRCVMFRDQNRSVLIHVLPVNDKSVVTGLAIDLGTSRVVLRIIYLETKEVLVESAFDNPQIQAGPDILARIHHTEEENGLDRLNSLIVDGLNQEIEKLYKSINLDLKNLYIITVAGNTTMTHLFLGVEPRWIIREPYIPALNRPGLFKAAELGILANSSARIFVFPNIGSYFGGDLIAGILYSGLHKEKDPMLLVDVGTNAEVVLGNKDWLIACAGAAGPALEGSVTRMGMMAGPGVIDKVKIDPETHILLINTIDDKPPIGICGSGLIDLAANLFLARMIDIRGKFVHQNCGSRLKLKDGIPYFVVVFENESATKTDLGISQADLDSLVRSKAAMFTILKTISSTVGTPLQSLSRFYVAGTFGSYINPKSAVTIGMIPDLPMKRFKSLGNSSLGGACMALTIPAVLNEIDEIRDRITYLELNVNQEFMNRFSAAKFIPHTDPSLFPSVLVP